MIQSIGCEIFYDKYMRRLHIYLNQSWLQLCVMEGSIEKMKNSVFTSSEIPLRILCLPSRKWFE